MNAKLCLMGLLIAVATAAAGSNGASAIEIRKFQSGSWNAGAYTLGQTAKFSHCAANATYKSGITMYVSIRNSYSWGIGFSHPSWNLQKGSKIDMSVTFDNSQPWTGKADVIEPAFVLMEMSDNSRLVEQFRLAYKMSVFAGGRNYGFNLDGTARLIPELVHCVRTELARERGEPLPQVAATSPPAPRPSQGSQPQPPSQNNELVAMRIATNLLLQARLPNAELVSAKDTPDFVKGHGVAWKADGAFGTVGVYAKSAARDAQAAATSLIESDAKVCKGDVVTSRSSELVDNKIISKALVMCKDSSGTWNIRYFVIDGEDAGWIVYALVDAGENALERPASITDRNFQTVALRSLGAR